MRVMLSETQWSRSIPRRNRHAHATGFLGSARHDGARKSRATITSTLLVGSSLLSFLLPAAIQASPSPDPAPSPSTRNVRISFLPPPLEGTISLGIYDGSGKLVLVLHREADIDDFEIGSDSLDTVWDGKDDSGAALPPGKYQARGYVVGDAQVEGVGFFFNDWVTDDRSPRVERVSAIGVENGSAVATVKLRDEQSANLLCDAKGNVVGAAKQPVPRRACDELTKFPQLVDPLDCAAGRAETVWVIDRETKNSRGTEVQQWSLTGELLRRLAISAEDPQPVQIAASATDDRILLLEENAAMQRLRGLTLLATKADSGQAVSEWKVEFEKKIVAHKNFGVSEGKPVVDAGDAKSPQTVSIKLQPNPLQKNERASVELAAGFDSSGSFLKTADGLPLQTISETPALSRVVLAPAGEKSLHVFQDDDAVVEQFRVSGLDRMMAFDGGDFELK